MLSIDHHVATLLVGKEDADKHLLVATLFAAVRMGHLCLRFTEEKSDSEIDKRLFNAFKRLDPCPEGLVIEDERLYLHRFWFLEKLFLKHFERLTRDSPAISLDQEKVSSRLKQWVKDKTLLSGQALAIEESLKKSLSMIVGGPGTGKTYSTSKWIEILLEAAPCPLKIAIAAPTGKAAARLNLPFETFTLHSLLNRFPGKEWVMDPSQRLIYDVIVVDEASMIDIKMMSILFACVKPGARLLLLGDPYQLPPVESGAVFSDIVEMASSVFELTQCVRTDLEEIVDFSLAIKNQDEKKCFEIFEKGMGVTCRSFEKDQKQLVDYIASRYLEGGSFCVLTSLRRGPFGVEALNRQVAERLTKQDPIPIIITSNDKELGLFNGEMGLLIEDTAFFKQQAISVYQLPHYELAFCLSIHKSQGSEWDEVILILDTHGEVFGNKALYTGATRAKKKLTIIAEPEVFSAFLLSDVKRESGINRK